MLPTVLLAVDMSVLHLALPKLSADLQPSSAQLLWITDIYGFLVAGFLIPMGVLGDRIGRRRLLLIGTVAFGLVSLLAAYAPTAGALIAARALLGVAGATLMPSTMSLIRNMFHDPAQRTVAISVWMTGFMGGMAIGPLVGGILLEHFWWGSVFMLNVPIMAVLIVAGPLLLPEYRDPAPGRIDLLSAVLCLAAVIAMIYGLKEIAAYGFGPEAVLAFLAGVVLAVVFVRRQRVLANPLLDMNLFRIRKFSASIVTLMLVVLIAPGVGFLIAQYMQLVLGLTPLQAGLWTLPPVMTVVVGFLGAPRLARRYRPGILAAVGLLLAAPGMALLALSGGPGSLAIMVAGQMLFYLGCSPLVVLGIDMVVGAAPPERAGAAAALSETVQEFGGAAGLAIFGSIATAIYRAQVSLPQGIPGAAAEAARDTLGGAVAAAAQLPDQLAAGLLRTARDAFTNGLHVAAFTATVIVLAASALSAVLLRHVPPTSAGEQTEPAADQPEKEEMTSLASNS
ncbi:MFS transporter [Longimycelium tulufanense]|uniref:MFS transporter n=2 Tax=Longimycelium tulufanense TaxID=907463 RepID=A0A8J3FYB2_9PSEU|nr:MFS transporter [Longimycelium tulufanense]